MKIISNYEIITAVNPVSPIADMYKRIKTNIEFSNPDINYQVIGVTSASEGEGKTTTIVNLAVCFAQQGLKTLIIDLDLRKPKVHRYFNLRNTQGITDVVISDFGITDLVQNNYQINNYINKTIHKVDVITAGSKTKFPLEFLNSKRLKNVIELFKKKYDVILLDGGPLGVVPDGLSISRLSDGMLIVVANKKVRKEQLKFVKQQLDMIGANIIGAILTMVPKFMYMKYGYYYGYTSDFDG